MDTQATIPEWQIIGDPGIGNLSFQESVLDTPSVNTRAGLYVYLNALTCGRPSFDDAIVTTFLNARYREDIADLVSDLILASFDVLANAIYRNESSRLINIIRSFLVNKLPPFLQEQYAALIFEPLTVEQCIRRAFGRIDPSAFPSLSQMFDLSGGNNILYDARSEFLFACALHGLIQEQSIEEILGDVPMQNLPAGGRYTRDDLVNQCTMNHTKIEQFVGELENMEGNAGEIANALVEILHTLCNNNDTMTLKGVCNTLTRKPVGLDIMMLFTSPAKLLQPLCLILDDWQDHDDQGEYQPVYDEFGSILLFVVSIRHRFNLAFEDIGLLEPSSYLRRYLRTSSISRPLDDLSQRDSEILGAWIKGLFEAEVISDELMSMCKPKEFHVLVATLFEQCIKARQNGALTFEKLRGGLDFLLEPFLLPSLVAGLSWFAQRLCEIGRQTGKLDIMFPVLSTLLKPATLSHEAASIHRAVLSVVAKPLRASLLFVQKQHPARSDVGQLLEVLNPYHDDRSDQAALKELASWSATPQGTLHAAMRKTVNSLVLWSATSASSTDMSPPSYTYRQLEGTVRILGAKAVLDNLLDEVLLQMSTSVNQDLVLDCISVMIVANRHRSHPKAEWRSPRIRLNLYDVLQLYCNDANELAQSDSPKATLVVRLQRRVDTLIGRKAEATIPTGNDFMTGVVQGTEGLPAADLDQVIADAQNQDSGAAAFMSGNGASLMGMA